jgi:hypothetical protein
MDAIKACHEAVHAMGTPRIAVSRPGKRPLLPLSQVLLTIDRHSNRNADRQADRQGRKRWQGVPSGGDSPKGSEVIGLSSKRRWYGSIDHYRLRYTSNVNGYRCDNV